MVIVIDLLRRRAEFAVYGNQVAVVGIQCCAPFRVALPPSLTVRAEQRLDVELILRRKRMHYAS